MKRLFIANLKMNPGTADAARKLFRGISSGTRGVSNAVVAVAPPAPFIPVFPKNRIMIGAQDVFWEKEGAYTGEISVSMLVSVGARFVIVGHSERRARGETDAMVNRKIKAVLASGIRAVLCVGEQDRTSENFQQFVRRQLIDAASGIAKKKAANLIIAYEPVWAIGTGKTVGTHDLFEMATYIRRTLLEMFGKAAALRIPVLYGGSVNASNARDFLNVAGVNGLLVGGASLHVEGFSAIVKSV